MTSRSPTVIKNTKKILYLRVIDTLTNNYNFCFFMYARLVEIFSLIIHRSFIVDLHLRIFTDIFNRYSKKIFKVLTIEKTN